MIQSIKSNALKRKTFSSLLSTHSTHSLNRTKQFVCWRNYTTDIQSPRVIDPFGIYEHMDEEDEKLAQLSQEDIRSKMPKHIRRNLRATEDKDPKAALQELIIGANEMRRFPLEDVDPSNKVIFGIGTQQHVYSIFRMLVTIEEWFTMVDEKLNFLFFTEEDFIPKGTKYSQITQIASIGMFCAEQLKSGEPRGIWIDKGTEHELYLHPSHFPSILKWHNSIHMEYAFQCIRVASILAFDQLEESDYRVRNEKLQELNDTIKSPLATIRNIQQILVVKVPHIKGKAIYLNDEELEKRGKKYICAFTAIDTATAFCEAQNIGFNNILQMSMEDLCIQIEKAKCHGLTLNRMFTTPIWRDRVNVQEINFTLDFIRTILKLRPNGNETKINEQIDIKDIQKQYEEEAKRMEEMKQSKINQYKKEKGEIKITQFPDDDYALSEEDLKNNRKDI